MNHIQIDIKNLSYAYHGQKNKALSDITLSIGSGEKIAVLGANGSGKSTFFLILNGILKTKKGMLFLNGEEVGEDKKQLKKLRQAVGVVFQDPEQQIVGQSVRHEIAFGLWNLGIKGKEAEQRVDHVLKELGLMELADRPPHYLSGGEKKKVTIGDLMVMNPEILLFDEPAAYLDPMYRRNLYSIFHKLSEQGRSLLVSTHDMDFGCGWAERIILLNKGRLIADGLTEEVLLKEELLKENGLELPSAIKLYQAALQVGKWKGKGIPRTMEEAINGIMRDENG